MNILDEDIRAAQRERLREQRTKVRQIGHDVGRKGMKDSEILPLLQKLRRPTFFTRDRRFGDRRAGHPNYCLVWLDVDEDRVAEFVRRVLRHPRLDTQAKRMGTLVRASTTDIRVWRHHGEEEAASWPR